MRTGSSKLWFILLLVTLTMLPVVAVAQSDQAGNVTEITYTFSGGKRTTDDTVIDMFNAAYEGNIHVSVQSTNIDGLKVNIVGGNAPDVALVDRFRIASVAAAGFLRPLDDLIARDGINPGDFFPPAWDECMFDGKVYCIPRSTDTRVMWYNKTMLEEFGLDGNEPPQTWEQTLDYSRKLTTWDGDKLATIGLPPIWGNWFFPGWLWASGGDLLDPTDRIVTWDGPDGLRTMAWIQDMMDLYGGHAGLNEFSSTYGSHLLRSGRQAFEINVFNYWDSRLSDVTDYEWGAANPPRPEGLEGTPISWSGGYGLAIPAGAENIDEAWELIKFYTTREAQLAVADTDIPVVASVATSPEMMDRTPFMRQIVGIMPYSKFRPSIPVSAELYTIYRSEIFNRYRDGEPPAAILMDTAQRAQLILDEGWAAYDERQAQ